MSWNEPGNGEGKDSKKKGWGNKEEGPPNIDEALKQLQRKLRSFFNQKEATGPNKTKSPRKFSFTLIAIIILVTYGLAGIYIVDPAEEAVVLRLGKYIGTFGPGPHWIPPIFETKEIVNVQEVRTSKHGGQMLTKDENIVSAEIAVQYRINNAKDYLFNLAQPEKSLKQVSESALRSVVGQSTLNEVLTSGRNEIGQEIKRQIQQILNNYKSGLEVSDLAMQQTKAPEEVKAAFDDAIKAQQDEERLVNEAQAYSRKIVPIAEGKSKRVFEEAKAYKERVILEAQGKTAKFAAILPEYQSAPRVTRERLFIETMQEVYTNTPKILIDVPGGNNLVYLPLDKIINRKDEEKKEEDDANTAAQLEASSSMSSYGPTRPSYDDTRPVRGGV
jgi:membrane protease subunit HflK